jgi:DNA-binding NarL/FixJ family response regulator
MDDSEGGQHSRLAEPVGEQDRRSVLRASPDALARAGCQNRHVAPSVLIVDDHEDFRRSARALLESDGFNVVGEAIDGADAITQAQRLHPDVVLIDIRLPDFDGFAVAQEISAWPDPPSVVLISSRDASVYRAQLATTRAHGFIAKSQLSGETLASILR